MPLTGWPRRASVTWPLSPPSDYLEQRPPRCSGALPSSLSPLDSYLTQVSNRLGMATKALGVVATFTLPFVVISAIWGMNFEHIPFHGNALGFTILVSVQVALASLILGGLKWRKLL